MDSWRRSPTDISPLGIIAEGESVIQTFYASGQDLSIVVNPLALRVFKAPKSRAIAS